MQRLDNRPVRYKTIFTPLDSAIVRGALCVVVWATAVHESRAAVTGPPWLYQVDCHLRTLREPSVLCSLSA